MPRARAAKPSDPAGRVRVLFPLDGSEPAYQAMEKAVRMLRPKLNLEATVLVVVQDFKGAPDDLVRMFEEDQDDEVFPTGDSAQEVFREMRRRVGQLSSQVNFRVAQGKPHKEILAAAHEHDLLVMHAKSRGGVLARGSHRLARKAPCDVLLVRP